VTIDDLEGRIIDGRYRIVERVGKGAMGSVYRGEHLKLGRVVAIKLINDQVPSEMSSRARFEREALAMAKLEHPNCTSVLDVGVCDDMPYVVMDFVSGTNLKDVLEAGALSIERSIDITRQVLAGLSCAHEHGIVHRDIKPANIVLSKKSGLGEHVKILDFGLAKFSQQASNLTSGFAVGTPLYMAPEQILGRAVDERTDLYACGVVLFELLTGRPPFQADNNDPVGTCMMHLNVDAPRLGDKCPGVEFGGLESVVARALAKDPTQRFATATEFAEALARSRDAPPAREPTASDAAGSLVATQPLGIPRRPRRIGVVLAVGAAIAAIAIVVTWSVTRDGPNESVAASPLTRDSSSESAPAPSPPVGNTIPIDAPGEPTAPPVIDPVADLVVRADKLVAAGDRRHAIDLLVKARKAHPSDARLPYHAGLIYVDNLWFADGLKQLRAAIALEPNLRSDARLITAVVRGFDTTAQYDWQLASFLHDDIGPAAKPYLEDIAQNHKNPIVRKRAAAELRRY
jgi:serine/threonine-protein kinase